MAANFECTLHFDKQSDLEIRFNCKAFIFIIMSQRELKGIEKILFPKILNGVSNVIIPTQLNLYKAIDLKILEKAVIGYIKTQPNLNSGVIIK